MVAFYIVFFSIADVKEQSKKQKIMHFQGYISVERAEGG
jgi:hypothetical protein